MNLLHELAKTSLTWKLERSSRVSPHNPERTETTQLLTLTPEPGAEPVTMHFRLDSPLDMEHMVALLMKRQLKGHPALAVWLASKGNVPVKLSVPEETYEYIGEPIHTALRKLAESKQSVITWNALHHMHSDDRVALWTAAANTVREALGGKTPPTRRNLATALKDKVIAVLEERRFAQIRDDEGREVKRKRSEDFALLVMLAGCELTEMAEWMWGWLGYLVEDIEEEDKEDAPA